MATPIGAVTGVGGLGMGNIPGVRLSLDWEPSPVIVAAQFAVLGMQFRSFREPLTQAVKQVIIPSIRKNFDMEGRPPWTPLSDFTLQMREYLGFEAGPILQRTGALKRGATQFNIWRIDSEKAYVSGLPERVSYGLVHQGGAEMGSSMFKLGAGASEAAKKGAAKIKARGGTGTGTVIPARPFLLIQDEDVDKIEDVFINWVKGRLRDTGFSVEQAVGGALIKTLIE